MSNSKKYGDWIVTDKINHDHGNVFMVRNEKTDQIGVLKLAKTLDREVFKTEIMITLKMQDHPNIVKILDYNTEVPWMVTKYYKGGDLDFQTFAAMSLREQNACFLHVFYTILYLLMNGVVYTDFTGNIFLDDDGWTPIVADMEGARPLKSVQDSIFGILSLGIYFNMMLNSPELSVPEFESYVVEALMNFEPEDYANLE